MRAQLVVALRRRARFGLQLPMLLAGGVSVIGGVAYVIASTGANPMLDMRAIYVTTRGIAFVIPGRGGASTPVGVRRGWRSRR